MHNFFIASTKDGYYNGVLVYARENPTRTDPSVQPAFTLHTEYFPDLTEDAVYSQGVARAAKLWGAPVELIENKANRGLEWG